MNSKFILIMQLTIEFYPAVYHYYDDNPVDPKKNDNNHRNNKEKSNKQTNKQNGHDLLNPFTKTTFLFLETFAKIIDSSAK